LVSLGQREPVGDSSSGKIMRYITHLARSDNGTNLTTGQLGGRVYLYGEDYYLQQVWASVGTAPTGATIIIDIDINGTTIFTTQGNRPIIGTSAYTSGQVTNMETTRIADGDYVTVIIDQVGSTAPGADLVVMVELLVYG